MRITHRLVGAACAVVVIVGVALSSPVARAGSNDISGTVRGAAGPEAGVWVIAETNDLETKFIKIVVTDNTGKYLIPDLPAASYQVWVRGYGLADSEKKRARPGESVAFTARAAANPQAAAQIYPSNYWYSLLQIPEAQE